MAKIHMIMQGKGGVGKSFASAILAQYSIYKKATPLCIDIDPINATFGSYKAFNVHKLDIMSADEISARKFDNLIELIAGTDNDVIIDNGASSFVPLSHYLLSNQIPHLLTEMGHELLIHTVITGGQAQLDTVSGFAQLAKQFPANTAFVVWLNPYWGAIEYEGKGFEQLKAYKDNQDSVVAIIRIPELKEETFGQDLAEILKERVTFDEAIAQAGKSIIVRQRLKIIQAKLFDQLDMAKVI